MTYFICKTCGVQYEALAAPPAHCPICEDERQYLPEGGQAWTTLAELQRNHQPIFREEEPNLLGIGTEPRFAIGQRMQLIQSAQGNVLWECMSLINDEAVAKVKSLGQVSAMSMSHPHFFSSIIEWSDALGGVPIYVHAADERWLGRRSKNIVLWQGDTLQLSPDVTLINCGGHFNGSSVLHWRAGANGKGVLLCGDTIYVVADRRYVSFMRSYPNLIPLAAPAVRQIVERVRPFQFDRIYSAWFGAVLKENAKAALDFSAQRYIRAIAG